MTKRRPLTQDYIYYYLLHYMVCDDTILETKNRNIKSSIKMKELCMCAYHQWSFRSTNGSYNPPFYG
ncbi:hypothetical protein WBS55_13795 [Bacillus luti]